MIHHITFDLESESTPREIELWVREMLMMMARGVPFSRITVEPKEAPEGRPLGRIE